MPSQTRSSLVSLASFRIRDPNNDEYTVAQVQAAIQWAQEQFVLDTRALRDSTTGSTVANQQEYALPTDVMDIIRLAVSGVELQRISKADLDFYNTARWDQTYGTTPIYFYVDLDPNNQKYGFYPIPSASGSSDIAIEYVKIPPVLSSDSSVPLDGHTLLIPFHNALAELAALDLLKNKTDPVFNLIKADCRRAYNDAVSDCIETFKHLEQTENLRFKGGRYHKGL